MSERRNPELLKQRLAAIEQANLDIDYHVFRGINNTDNKCYAISLLQLLFLCPDFIDYISSHPLTNINEKLLKDIYDTFYSNKSNSISINNFFKEWKGWEGSKVLPDGVQDINEFFLYFMNSISDDL